MEYNEFGQSLKPYHRQQSRSQPSGLDKVRNLTRKFSEKKHRPSRFSINKIDRFIDWSIDWFSLNWLFIASFSFHLP